MQCLRPRTMLSIVSIKHTARKINRNHHPFVTVSIFRPCQSKGRFGFGYRFDGDNLQNVRFCFEPIGGRLCLFSFLICLDTVLIPSNYDLMVQNRTFFRSDLTRNWMAQFECVLPFMKRFIGYEG